MSTLRRYITQMQQSQPSNGLGKPTALVNPQAVLSTGFLTPIDKLIDTPPPDAIMHISYLEGIPTIQGVPIWEKFEGEPIEYYKLFKRYRDMKYAKTARAVYKLALETNSETRQLEALRQIYHWNTRVEAYDDYMQREREVLLEMKRLEIENKHAQTAEQLFKISSKYLSEHEDLLTPKVAMQMLDMAIKLERYSVGMFNDRRNGDNAGTTVNINNTMQGNGNTSASMEEGTTITGKLDDDKQRLTQLVNIMNQMGLIKDKEPAAAVVDVESEDIIE